MSSPGLLLSDNWHQVPPSVVERDWSAVESFRRRSSQELDASGGAATSFPVHKAKWLLSCSVTKVVTSPHQFLSSQSDFWLLFLWSELQIPPNQRFPLWSEFWDVRSLGQTGGERSLNICQVESWSCTWWKKKRSWWVDICLEAHCHLWVACREVQLSS